MFNFSERSCNELQGVHPNMVIVSERAIQITVVDFGVIEGVRELEEQRQHVANGVSKTMNSLHLLQDDGYSHAVDVMAYIGSKGKWELPLYFKIADAYKQAAIDCNVAIRWGGAWHIKDIRQYKGTMQEAHEEYVAIRKSQGRKPFIDGPHFELS